MTMPFKLGATVACLLLLQTWPATAWDIDMQMLISDTQRIVQEDNHLMMIWWIPNEYWEAQAQVDPSITPEMLEQMHGVLGEYVVFAIVDGLLGPFAGITGRERDNIAAELFLKLDDGTVLEPIPREELSPDMLNLTSMMTPLFAQMMGKLGEATEIFTFQARDEKGVDLIKPAAEGGFTLGVGERKFAWRLPLGSLLPPRFDPRTGETFPGNYRFNPYSGKKLRTKKE